jgi:multicomponent Na+:H+ antiporter subunit B
VKEQSILRVVSKLLIPYILLFALYVQFHGDYGPGGGFQAGVIFASGIILYGLVFGLHAARQVAPPAVMERLTAMGVLIYAGTGVAAMLGGGNFLDYSVLQFGFAHGTFLARNVPQGQHLGILLVELGVGITVAAVLILIFFSFAGRERLR